MGANESNLTLQILLIESFFTHNVTIVWLKISSHELQFYCKYNFVGLAACPVLFFDSQSNTV